MGNGEHVWGPDKGHLSSSEGFHPRTRDCPLPAEMNAQAPAAAPAERPQRRELAPRLVLVTMPHAPSELDMSQLLWLDFYEPLLESP